MEGRRAVLQSSYVGTPTYYAQQRGVGVDVSVPYSTGLADPTPGFRYGLNEGLMLQLNGHGSAFQIDSLNSSYQHNANIGSLSGTAQGELVKKKRGRPRKHGLDNSVALVLCERVSQGSIAASQKQKRGRPPGSGRKQKLASIGGWMNSLAGKAFAPVVLFIKAGENVASKILQFSCQRPRAFCIVSGSGIISSVTICQHASSNTVSKHEGHFDIIRLSGSYLVPEVGSNKRTGGLNISLSGSDGLAFGGVVGNTLIADSPVKVDAFSFIYDCSKSVTKDEEEAPRPLKYEQEEGELSTAANNRPNHPTSAGNRWPSSQPLQLGDPHTGIDLMRR